MNRQGDDRNESIINNDQPESLSSVPPSENDVLFLIQNSYGLPYGDDEAGEYEFIRMASPMELFQKAYQKAFNAMLAELEDYRGTELVKNSKDTLEKAQIHVEIQGLAEEALSYLMSIDPFGDRDGIPW